VQIEVSQIPDKPLLIYDGDCNFCMRWIDQWKKATGNRVEYISSQEILAAGRFPEIPAGDYSQSVQLVETDGLVYNGAEAVFRSLAHGPNWGWLLRLYQRSELFAKLNEAVYAFVATHRMFFSMLTRWILPDEETKYDLTRSLFLRLLGLVYLCAFVSLVSQVSGLVGPEGIQPFQRILQIEAGRMHGIDRLHQMPTLCWWLGTSDPSLQGQCIAGIVCAVLLMAGVLPLINLILLWILYLSMTVAGDLFMSFQWENLLLEAGLIAVFFAPASLTLRRAHNPSKIGLFLARWLTFRLMFESGWVKLASGDPAWRNLLALDFHYETQPLPTMLGFVAHQTPHFGHAVSIIVMLFIELALPFLIFGPRRGRILCAAGFASLQLIIGLTGNYGFFNLLTIVLCVPLIDDGVIAKMFGFGAPSGEKSQPRHRYSKLKLALRGSFLVLVLLITGVQLLAMMGLLKTWNEPVRKTYAWVYPARSLNTYGLFAVMTTNRTEIVIEGSEDGKNWKPYEFKYKPGDPARRPRFAGTHMPRLDWQMWFAALGTSTENTWIINFCFRLLEGDKAVIKLLRSNPFAEKPPIYIRAMAYEYQFTDMGTQFKTGRWWVRKQTGIYLPPISMKSGL
jgi:predicted DCC family thiol-disulfide oxidoreductase YuxK